MAEERIEGVNPTRMELLQIRKRIKLADKGHELLEEKRDALVERFFKIIDQRKELKKEIDEKFDQAFQSLLQTEMLMGEHRVEEIADIMQAVGKVDFETENVMGVKIPSMIYEKEEEKEKSMMYDFMDTCAEFDKAQQRFKEIVSKLIELADLEGGINALAGEIEKTKRRVNVLENNLIPKLENTRNYIEMQLEEREREDFLRRKRIKALMEEE
ncbi:MAG: V-type ATP synthase subunit D [Candidatus Thermoplasmatota archaeon]